MEKGKVVNTDENGSAYIQMELNRSCRSCSNRAFCMNGDEPASLKIRNEKGFQKGDIVEIEMPAVKKLTAGFLLFILPLILMITGFYAGYRMYGSENAGITGSLTGLAAGILIDIIISKYSEASNIFKPLSIKKTDPTTKDQADK